MENLETLLLCGGLGTRLREETEFKPKPMVEIGERPILWHIMKIYRSANVMSFVLCLGYKGDVIRDYFLNYRGRARDVEIDLGTGSITTLNERKNSADWRVTLVETGLHSLTGLRIKKALKYVKSNTFFATYGDGLANVDLEKLLAHHKSMGRLATVTAVHPSSRFGELTLDGHIVSSFAEKPQLDDGWINGGYFVFEKEAFDLLREDENVSLEGGLLEKLANEGNLAVYRHDGFWQCMDTSREAQLLNSLWSREDAPWKIWTD